MTESLHDELFVEPKSSFSLKVIAAIAALVVTIGVFAGYAYLRQRHAGQAVSTTAPQMTTAAPRLPAKALIKIDDATLQSGKTTLSGTVLNTSNEELSNLSVELELVRRANDSGDTKIVTLQPSTLQPNQEGRYSIQVPAQDYAYARLVGLKGGPNSVALGYNATQGQKRPLERTPSKTITVDQRPGSKRDEFLNSPDNPARVP